MLCLDCEVVGKQVKNLTPSQPPLQCFQDLTWKEKMFVWFRCHNDVFQKIRFFPLLFQRGLEEEAWGDNRVSEASHEGIRLCPLGQEQA